MKAMKKLIVDPEPIAENKCRLLTAFSSVACSASI
jgi:hypothetical protein